MNAPRPTRVPPLCAAAYPGSLGPSAMVLGVGVGKLSFVVLMGMLSVGATVLGLLSLFLLEAWRVGASGPFFVKAD